MANKDNKDSEDQKKKSKKISRKKVSTMGDPIVQIHE